MLFIFSKLVLIRHVWQLKTVVLVHWCQICAVPLKTRATTKAKAKAFKVEVSLTIVNYDCNNNFTVQVRPQYNKGVKSFIAEAPPWMENWTSILKS